MAKILLLDKINEDLVEGDGFHSLQRPNEVLGTYLPETNELSSGVEPQSESNITQAVQPSSRLSPSEVFQNAQPGSNLSELTYRVLIKFLTIFVLNKHLILFDSKHSL